MEQLTSRGGIAAAGSDRGSFFLVVQSADAAQGTLLFIGSGVLADSLAKVLTSHGLKLQRAASDHALASARTHTPSMVVLAGDAARDRGLSIRNRLEQLDKDNPLPVLVILAPELGGLATQPLPRHVGYLAPTGGVNECARRVQALVELFSDEGLASCSLQQLADTVSSRGKADAANPEPAAKSSTSTANQPAVVASKAAPPPLKPSQAAAPTQSKAAPPPLKVSQAPTPDAVTPSKAAPPPLKVTHSAASSALVAAAMGGEPTADRPEPIASKTSAAVSSKAAASAFSAAPAKSVTSPFAPVERAKAAAESMTSAATSKLAVAISAQPQPTAAAVVFEPADTSARLKRPDPLPSAVAPTEAVTARPPSSDAAEAGSAPEEREKTDRPTKRPKRGARKSGAPARSDVTQQLTEHDVSLSKREERARVDVTRSLSELDVSLSQSDEPPRMEPITVAPPAEPQPAAPGPRESVPSRTRTRLGLPQEPSALQNDSPAARVRDAKRAEIAARRGPTRDMRAAASIAAAQSAEDAARTTTGDFEAASGSDAKAGDSPRRPKTGDFDAAPSGSHAKPADSSPRRGKTAAFDAAASGSHAQPGDFDAARSGSHAKPAENSARRPKTGDFDAASSGNNAKLADSSPRRAKTASFDAAASGSHEQPGDSSLGSKTGDFDAASSGSDTKRAEPNPFAVGNSPRRPKTGELDAAHSGKKPSTQNHPARKQTGAVAAQSLPAPEGRPNARDVLAARSLAPAENADAGRKPTARDILASPSFSANDNAARRSMPANDNAAVRKPTARDILAAPSFPANDNAAAARKPALSVVRTPLDTPSAQLPEVALQPTATPANKRRWPMWLGLAAVSCAGLTYYGLYMQPSRDSGHAALGSLEQVPALAAPSDPVRADAASQAATASATPRKSDASSSNLAATSSNPQNAGAKPGTPARAADADTDLGRARALVEEGAKLQSQGRLGLAESSYQKALALVPEYPSAMAALVRVHLARKDGNEALRWATRLVAKQPKDGVSQLLLGDALALRGDLEGAQDAWSDSAKLGNATARERLQ